MSDPELSAARPTPDLSRARATAVLEQSLAGFRGDLTIADAAARGGLALRDAEDGLRRLASHRGGHLKATEAGEIIYSFPDGLARPADAGWARRSLRRAGQGLLSVGRFVVRAWVSVVMVGYALVFLAVMIGLASRDDDRGGIGGALSMVGQVLIEALYWTLHPFSPVSLALQPGWSSMGGRPRARRVPFYERVNRFVFGPPRAAPDPRLRERDLVGEIRRLDGRIGPGDVMRVTGLPRAAAERELLRLVVDYDGDIQVSQGDDAGAIVYVFKALRSTAVAAARAAQPPAPIWSQSVTVPPLTGNTAVGNALLMALNGFNLAASAVAVSCGLTIDRLTALVDHARAEAALGMALPPLPPASDAALLLGWVPLVFSAALFALPLCRALGRRREAARAAAENGRRALLRLVLGEPGGRVDIEVAEAERAWAAVAANTGRRAGRPRAAEIEAAVRALGGEVELTEDGAVVYRFEAEAREARALAQARASAAPGEALPGRVVFASSQAGTGEVDERVSEGVDEGVNEG